MDLTPAFVEREYNNRAAVPDHPRWFARYAELSAAAVAQFGPVRDLRYGAGPKETLDLFLPAGPAKATFVFLHGGYWRALDKRDVSYVAPAFVDAGAMVVVPNYALAPAVRVQDIALQCARAVAWTVRHAALYGGNPSHVVVAGHSAGGHLAAMLAGCDWKAVDRQLPARAIKAAVSISGLHELEPIRRTPFLQADLRLTPASARLLSPALWPAPRGVQMAAWVGGAESSEFRRQNRLLREAWGAKVVTTCDEVPGADHFTVMQDFVDASRPLHRATLALLGLA